METLGIIVIIGVLILFVFVIFSDSNRRREEMMLGQGMFPMGMNPYDPRSMNRFMEMYYQFRARKQGEAIVITLVVCALGLGVIFFASSQANNNGPVDSVSSQNIPKEQQREDNSSTQPQSVVDTSTKWSKVTDYTEVKEQLNDPSPEIQEDPSEDQVDPLNVEPKSDKTDPAELNGKPLELHNDGTISLNVEWTSFIQVLSGWNKRDVLDFAAKWDKKLDKPVWILEENGAYKVLVGAFPNRDAVDDFIRFNRLPQGAFYKDCSGLALLKVVQ